jgi:ATP-binding cassette subfamily F protein uup
MVLDEPTNDLDAETLELLEELVDGYNGTVLLVSHDRAFLNNVVTSTLVFEGDGRIKEYDGGYDDYIRARDASARPATEQMQPKPSGKPVEKPSAARPKKLSYKERQELEHLPQAIEELEAEQAQLHVAMAAPEYFRQDADVLTADAARLEEIATELSASYERWEELAARE